MKHIKQIYNTLVLCLALVLVFGMLTGCGQNASSSNASNSYEVLVNDETGKPVSGVTIQFCSDTECIMDQTDEKGIAVFEKEAGKYTVHVLKAPEGYAADDTEYPAPAEPGRMTIVLK